METSATAATPLLQGTSLQQQQHPQQHLQQQQPTPTDIHANQAAQFQMPSMGAAAQMPQMMANPMAAMQMFAQSVMQNPMMMAAFAQMQGMNPMAMANGNAGMPMQMPNAMGQPMSMQQHQMQHHGYSQPEHPGQQGDGQGNAMDVAKFWATMPMPVAPHPQMTMPQAMNMYQQIPHQQQQVMQGPGAPQFQMGFQQVPTTGDANQQAYQPPHH